MVNNPLASAGDIRDAGLIPGLGRFSGEGNNNPLQYPCLENLMDREAWQATVHRVAKGQIQLSDFHLNLVYLFLYSFKGRASLVAQLIKNLPIIQETWV